MDAIDQSSPHFALRAAKKLNPKLQCWIWYDGAAFDSEYFSSIWLPIDTPAWLPHRFYAVTSSKEEKPSWTPKPRQPNDRGLNYESTV